MQPLQRLALWLSLSAAPLASLRVAGPDPEPARQEPEKKARDVSQYNLDEDGLALGGFDPVTYFPEGGGRAMKGLAELEVAHEGVRYRFASAETRAIFAKEPAKFEPQYGGWCAFAMAGGDKVEIDPKSFLVADGELFVFHKSLVSDSRKKWLKDAAELQPRADRAWAKLLERK
jgi:hypothetical protein